MNAVTRPGAGEAVGALLLAAVPAALVALLAAVVAAPLSVPTTAASAVGAAVGLLGGVAAGPLLIRRTVRGLPAAEDDAVTEAVDAVAVDLGIPEAERPAVRVVDSRAATLAAVDGGLLGTPTLVVPTRFREFDDAARDAAIAHALTRLRNRNALLVTLTLGAALLVELWTLVGIELLRHRDADDEDEGPRMLGERDRRRGIPPAAYTGAGVLLLLLAVPFWIAFALGDRLLVGGGRRRADDAVRAMDRGEGLIDALAFARDAAGDRDWPPALDRLSVSPLSDPATRRARGTGRNETRLRLARIHATR
ncbi:hypothetical protein [Haloparvum sedimenti]|uniref:hypothetical protein n=1 Tax=Haloparvum sedimenti TaxID=1678448 RepID=UPI00071E9B15|nr:hypothetical protein [Haloparvum sedimenti]